MSIQILVLRDALENESDAMHMDMPFSVTCVNGCMQNPGWMQRGEVFENYYFLLKVLSSTFSSVLLQLFLPCYGISTDYL